MGEIIRQSLLNEYEKTKLEAYYGTLPSFSLYRLNSTKELCKIDRRGFVQDILKKHKEVLEKNISFYYRYRGKNYIVLINGEDIFHEISHLMFKDQLDDIFSKKQLGIRDFLDEIIAECNSTRILGKSKFFPEIKRGAVKKVSEYHIGVAFAMYKNLGNNAYEKCLKDYVDKIKPNLEFNANEITNINKEAIISILKK